jgi:hypothetical protein
MWTSVSPWSKEKVKRMSTFSPNTSLGSLTKDEDALKHERFCEIKSQRDLQALVLCMAIKCADLGHCALPLAAGAYTRSLQSST